MQLEAYVASGEQNGVDRHSKLPEPPGSIRVRRELVAVVQVHERIGC